MLTAGVAVLTAGVAVLTAGIAVLTAGVEVLSTGSGVRGTAVLDLGQRLGQQGLAIGVAAPFLHVRQV